MHNVFEENPLLMCLIFTVLIQYLTIRQTVHTQHFIIQGDEKVSVHLMITIQKFSNNVQSVPRQSPDTELCSVIPNSKYVIMVGD